MYISGNILLFVHLDKGHVSLCLHLTSSIFPFVLIRHVLICSTAKLLNHTWEEEIQICANGEGLLRVLKRENYINLKQFSSQEPATFFAVQHRYDR